MIAGGIEEVLNPTIIHACRKMNAMALLQGFESPSQVSRPFDAKRNGFVLGEGSGILVLEVGVSNLTIQSYDSATSRGAEILCEITGSSICSDSFHLTKPSSEGAFRSMKMTLEKAFASMNPPRSRKRKFNYPCV